MPLADGRSSSGTILALTCRMCAWMWQHPSIDIKKAFSSKGPSPQTKCMLVWCRYNNENKRNSLWWSHEHETQPKKCGPRRTNKTIIQQYKSNYNESVTWYKLQFKSKQADKPTHRAHSGTHTCSTIEENKDCINTMIRVIWVDFHMNTSHLTETSTKDFILPQTLIIKSLRNQETIKRQSTHHLVKTRHRDLTTCFSHIIIQTQI